MKKVTKAVIPAAGLGTRVLPATKAMPKGMLPLVDKPAIQYLVEEAVRSGITDILIIVSRNQDIIQDHFDRSPELEAKLAAPGKEKMLEECLGISNLANIFFVRQQQTLGLGHAVSMAKPFTGDDPFVVIYGDDVIWGEDPVCAQLIRAYEEFGRPAAGVSAVPMAARVSQKVGQAENPGNFLLMHAMGPNVAGVIGSAIAAGVLISLFG